MPLALLHAQPDDVPTLLSIYFESFQNPFAHVGFPDIPTVRQWWHNMLTDEINDPNALWLKIVEHNEENTASHGNPIIS